MFLRSTQRRKDGKVHRYWSLVENRRVSGGRVVQRPLLYLGEINDSQREAWRKTIEVFEAGAPRPHTMALFPEDGAAPLNDESVVRIRLSQLRGPGADQSCVPGETAVHAYGGRAPADDRRTGDRPAALHATRPRGCPAAGPIAPDAPAAARAAAEPAKGAHPEYADVVKTFEVNMRKMAQIPLILPYEPQRFRGRTKLQKVVDTLLSA